MCARRAAGCSRAWCCGACGLIGGKGKGKQFFFEKNQKTFVA
jgi:hypothetical protein